MNTVASEIIFRLDTIRHCVKNGNREWELNHYNDLKKICQRYLPHGSGIDNTIPECLHGLWLISNDKMIKISISFHHMNDGGYYDGWTDHIITVRPMFTGIGVYISGKNRNDIKDYLSQLYYESLSLMIEWKG